MIQIILKSIKDILSPMVLSFILKITFFAFLIMVNLLWIFWDDFTSILYIIVSSIPYIGHYSLVQSVTSYLGSLIIAYALILIVISILTSIYSPKLILQLAKKEYVIEGKDNSNILKSIFYTIKSGLIFLILLIIFMPLIFIPVIGQIVMLILWAILLKEPTFYDVSSLFIDDEKKYIKSKSLWIIAIIASIFNYIPILSIFSPIFAQILFMHWLLSKIK